MKALTFLLVALISFKLHASPSQVVLPKDVCTHNILSLYNGVKPALDKAKKSFFSKDEDKIMAANYKQLASLNKNDQLASSKAMNIFKKVHPIILKNAKDEFGVCTQMMEAMSKATVQACPNLKNTDPEFQKSLAKCSETANKTPEVVAENAKWEKAVSKLAAGR